MYQWITKYQWITILCILLFFLFVSINNKECFSVGFESDISISSNLLLKDVCHKPTLDNGSSCISNASCQSNFCFPINNEYNVSATCQTKSEGEKTTIGIDYTTIVDSINNYLDGLEAYNLSEEEKQNNINFFKDNFSEYNSSFVCKNESTNDVTEIINKYNTIIDSDNVKLLCDSLYDILPEDLKTVAFKKDNDYMYCKDYINLVSCNT